MPAMRVKSLWRAFCERCKGRLGPKWGFVGLSRLHNRACFFDWEKKYSRVGAPIHSSRPARE